MNNAAELKDYFRLMTANGMVHVYHAAWRHGIFDGLADGPQSLATLAESTGSNETALRLLLDALVALGTAAITGTQYRLGKVMQAFQGNYRSLGDEHWRHLDEFLKTGQPARRMNSAEEGESAYREQASALAWMMAPAACLAASKLKNLLPGSAKILDIGAGSGVWSLALLAASPESAATLVDWPGVLNVAKQFAIRAGVDSRVHHVAGDYHEVRLPAGAFDLAIVGNVCHLETREGNEALFQRIAAWLKPGGRIAVLDVCATEEPLSAALYALGLALRTESGAVHPGNNITDWMQSVGFVTPEFHALPVPPGTTGLWTAQRPVNA